MLMRYLAVYAYSHFNFEPVDLFVCEAGYKCEDNAEHINTILFSNSYHQ